MGLRRYPYTVDVTRGVDAGENDAPIVVITFDHGHGIATFVCTPHEARTLADRLIAAGNPPATRQRPLRAHTRGRR